MVREDYIESDDAWKLSDEFFTEIKERRNGN